VKPGLFQILIIALIVLVLFGRGRISEMMGDFGKGIKSFKRGIADDEPARLETAEAVAEPAADKTAG
jgi:sec-independent protein translocase protein TatA